MVALACSCDIASAVNIAFMPGDAFYSSRLTAEVVASASTERPLVLHYASPPGGGFCGFAGFEKLEITGLSEQMVSALRNVYAHNRKHRAKELRIDVDDTGKESAIEINGFKLFVYPKDVDWQQQKIGLKYNEHWMNLPIESMVGRRDSNYKVKAEHYMPFILTAEAVAEDWKNATRFNALPVRVSEGTGYGLAGPRIEESVSIGADQIQFVVLSDDDLEYYFARTDLGDSFQINIDTTFSRMYFPSAESGATDEDEVVEKQEWPGGVEPEQAADTRK